jgi:hypothetical protein
MKPIKLVTLLMIVSLLIVSCGDFAVFETPTPATPQSLGVATPTLPAEPTPLPDELVISADAVEPDQTCWNLDRARAS